MIILKPQEMDEYRLYIARLCNIPAGDILINQYSRFEIYQVKESDKHMMVYNLQRDPLISDVTCSSSGFDFSRISYPGLPSQKYTITGLIHPEENIDDDISNLKY